MHNNSWSMTLPFDVNWTTDMCHIFRDRAHLQTQSRSLQWLPHFLPHHMQFMLMLSNPVYNISKVQKFSLILPSLNFAEILPLHTATTLSMNTTDYWPMARKYSIWNAAIASLQFWAEDLDPVTLGKATEHVYTTFFYSPSSHTLHQQSDEILFGHFVIALNAAFDQQLSLADEGYKSGSDTIDLPTPLRKTPCISPCFQHGTRFIWFSSHTHHTVHYKLHQDMCADMYPSFQQTATVSTAFQNAQKVWQMKRKTSRWYL